MIQEIKKLFSLSNLKSNILVLLSGICFSLLVFHPEKLWLAVSASIIIVAGSLSLLLNSLFKRFIESQLLNKCVSVMSALLLLSYICARNFFSTWIPSNSIIMRVASIIHLSNTTLIITLCIIAVLSLLFLSLLFNLLYIELRKLILDTIKFTKPKSFLLNLKKNIILIISAFCFMGMNIQINKNSILSFFVSCILIVIVFSQITNIYKKMSSIPLFIIVYSFISSIGICYYARTIFLESVSSSSRFKRLLEKINLSQHEHIRLFSVVIMLLSIVAVFIFVSLLLDYVNHHLKDVFKTISKNELIIYSVIIAALLGFVCYVFLNSNAFWGTDQNFDIIYTSDSSLLVKSNAYLRLYHVENDLRQPLYAVFAAPFVGVGYALSVPFSHYSPVITPLFMNIIQVIMLVVANLMLARILQLDSKGRIMFVLLSTVTYSALLFSVMMEQYIVAYFWLIYVIYSYIEYKKSSVVSLSAAGGALLTSLVLLPTTYSKSENSISNFISAMLKSILGFFIVLLSFGRLDIILNFTDSTSFLSKYAGGISLFGRFNQYLSFVSSCFIAPDAIIDRTKYDHISWQLNNSNISHISLVGIIILAVCVVSFFVNRKNTLTKISFLWICFSFIMLCVIGWGSAENGMILYSLYFGWAFLVLIYQFIKWIADKTKFKSFIPITSGIIIAALSIVNYFGIRDLLAFAFTYYPL